MIRRRFRSNLRFRKVKLFFDSLNQLRYSKVRCFRYICKENENLVVLDVGANIGQFAIDFINVGFKGEIHSFEPVNEYFLKLRQIAKNFSKWTVWNLALGQENSESKIHVSGNDGLSSSLLKMNALHLKNFPLSATVRNEKIQIRTLEKFMNDNILVQIPIFLKIDVQGFEMNVLKGLKNRISDVKYVFLEASMSPLYEGESEIHQLMTYLHEQGFTLVQIFNGLRDKRGFLLQVDLLFIKSIAK